MPDQRDGPARDHFSITAPRMPSTRPQLLLLTAFGLGRIPIAPGTWGSLPPVCLSLLMLWITDGSESSGARFTLVNGLLIVLALLSAWVCLQFGAVGEQHFGRKDPGSVVADEVCGQSIALLFLPWRTMDAAGWKWNLLIAGTAFIAFRLIDITKPPPARSAQNFNGGLGILIDDVIAGVYALVIAQCAARLIY